MSHSCKYVHSFTLMILLAMVVAPDSAAQRSVWPDSAKNLTVLPQSISAEELEGVMRTFTRSLGVRCEHCHVQEPGQPFNEIDFAKDGKEAKETTRIMLKMVRAINSDYIAQLSGHAKHEDHGIDADEHESRHDHVSVTCITCHRGRPRPEMLQDVLVETTLASGVDSAITRYRELRDDYYGGFAFDFRQGTLTDVAETLVESEEVDAALAMMKLELEVNGESPQTLASLARVQADAGMKEDAIQTLERAIGIATGNTKRGLERQLERLRQ